MYLNHYHLESKPFGLTPSPKFLWWGEKHLEAIATLQYGINEDLGFLLLTGDVGVGKTALIHHLIDNLDSSTIVANITDPKLEPLEFFKTLAVEFNITAEFNGKGEFLIEFEKFLHRAYSNHKKVLLIVDEAQRLNDSLLDQIRVLSNIELSYRKLINIFFVGQPEFKNMLMVDNNRAIRQRIAINYHINPLTESETRQYIEHRLKVAGATRKIFKSNAFGEIFRTTGGYPRAINIICDHALLTGYVSGSKFIDSGVIKECKRELNARADFDISGAGFQTTTAATWTDTSSPPPRRSPVKVYSLLIGICIVIGAFVSYYFLWPATRGTITSMTQKLAESSIRKADTAANNQLKPSEKIEKEQDQVNIASDEAQSDLALLSAPSDAKPKPPPDKATQRAEINEQDAPYSKAKTSVAGRQPEISTDRAVPANDKLSAKPEVESDVTKPAKTGKNVVLMAALPDAKAKPQLNLGARVSNATGKSETTPLKSESTTGSNAAASNSKKKVSSSTPTTKASSKKTNLDNQTPANKGTQPEKVSSANRPDSLITAKAETQLQPSKEQIGGTAPSVKQPGSNGMESRLRSFLHNYCTTYAAKDLDAFTIFFAPNASENGKPFESLLPKYQRNFKFIESIQYRIELQQFSYDDNKEIVEIDGNFFLKWLSPNKTWRENSGIITMSLRENGASFLVQRLDYHSTHSKKATRSES